MSSKQSNAQSSHPWSKSYPVDISWDSELLPQTLPPFFDENVKKYKDRTALKFLGKEMTYGELGALVNKFAKGLQDQGIGPGSKVGLCLPNCPFYVIAYYGAL